MPTTRVQTCLQIWTKNSGMATATVPERPAAMAQLYKTGCPLSGKGVFTSSIWNIQNIATSLHTDNFYRPIQKTYNRLSFNHNGTWSEKSPERRESSAAFGRSP